MIGEIRDLETAQIAVQASLTGHLVFATLHTNDAVSAVTRLVDMGVEPFLLASSLIGVGAQRLVRKLCLECRKPARRADAAAQLRSLGLRRRAARSTRRRAAPRATARATAGRTGIYELLTVDDELRRLIHDRAAEQALRRARRGARHALAARRRHALGRAQGVISLEEVVARDRGNRTMEAFRYEALDAAGRTVSGVVQADTARQARTQVRAQGLLPSSGRPSRRARACAAPGRAASRRPSSASSPGRWRRCSNPGSRWSRRLNALIEEAAVPVVREVLAGVKAEVMAGPVARRRARQPTTGASRTSTGRSCTAARNRARCRPCCSTSPTISTRARRCGRKPASRCSTRCSSRRRRPDRHRPPRLRRAAGGAGVPAVAAGACRCSRAR